ncbi:hypothetical protein E4T66_13945 [Sinimarinibacterium sp. CAU 1509]|uniref:c-type cytochrome n=1 Tax=Sinimarinibacterium sp. CAU 1509 TaxID=2562283 RepID=UPI0010AC14AE|nr:hypothetical protein [Sinimarinibacterium sp. CAU 1509]TJY59480.1 hypothetical protein E4T66_13945 [Sinimarinibacterium sp. CAU 1509]
MGSWLEKAATVGCAAMLLAGCGDYSGGSQPISGSGGGSSATARSMEEHFASKVQPQLDFCRNCHVPGGVADVADGRDFMLSAQQSEDLANLRSSWELLGGNNPTSRILLMASGEETPHSGGAPWTKGSAPYRNVEILLECFENPDRCRDLLAGGIADGSGEWPLLAEGHRGGHAWSRYCEDKDDSAALPANPVTLIQPGVNAGKAVYFNAYYKNCHVDAAPEDAAPTTCGEWRARIERGGVIMKGNGVQGAAGNFIGNFPGETVMPGFFVTAEAYNGMWRSWGLSKRPENYDQLVSSRWGVVLDSERNPYPLPGEDPNLTNGGSGQLPTAMTQLRETDGRWSGKLATTCHACHSGQIGLPGEPGLPGAVYGTNSLSDIGVMGRDILFAGYAVGPVLTAFTQVRGLGNITNFQVFNAISALVTPGNLLPYLLMQTSGSTGSEDPPVWWNFGHRPLKFFDGGMSSDAQRILISAFTPAGSANPVPFNISGAFEWIEQHDQDAAAWVLDRRSPAYPEPVDTALAEQGAVLFHAKDLFALTANAGRERPKGGNGSCAGCHGAYSPRYVHDTAYLETAELEGVAGYIVPRDLIGTDPRRVDGNDQAVAQTFENDWFGYPEQRGTENDCGDQNLDRIRGDRENGYLAPPLYGVWATAPYFHNGSVPSVWEVLKSSDRKLFWRRQSAPNDTGLDVVMGFDPSFERAYDKQHLGWKYEEIPCGAGGAMPYLECDPSDPTKNPLLEQILSVIYANGGLAWNIPNLLQTPLTKAQVEDRKIYNTRLYSQDNGGHTFTDALTDQERRAIIEYLKTL